MIRVIYKVTYFTKDTGNLQTQHFTSSELSLIAKCCREAVSDNVNVERIEIDENHWLNK